MDLFEELLKSEGGSSPPLTTEEKLRESIDTLAHKMETELKNMTEELTNVKNKLNEKENNYEENNNQRFNAGDGEEREIQDDTKPTNGND